MSDEERGLTACPECEDLDCPGPCDDCGAWTCVGEMHGRLCCATDGLDAIDREEMAREEEDG